MKKMRKIAIASFPLGLLRRENVQKKDGDEYQAVNIIAYENYKISVNMTK